MSKVGSKASPVLKAGHPPAVKAGGKRVSKKSLEDGSSASHGAGDKEAKRPLGTFSRMQQVGLLLGGTLDKLSHTFPETPVGVRHSRLRPSVEKPHLQRVFFIQQPRK